VTELRREALKELCSKDWAAFQRSSNPAVAAREREQTRNGTLAGAFANISPANFQSNQCFEEIYYCLPQSGVCWRRNGWRTVRVPGICRPPFAILDDPEMGKAARHNFVA